MNALFGFAVGYILGARLGSDSFDEVIKAANEVRRSEEFANLVDTVRNHAVGTVSLLAGRLARRRDPMSAQHLLEQADERARGAS